MYILRQLLFIFGIYIPPKITDEEIAAKVLEIKEEHKQRRMFLTPPPFHGWYDPILKKSGSNYAEIMRWHSEHFDWMEDKETRIG